MSDNLTKAQKDAISSTSTSLANGFTAVTRTPLSAQVAAQIRAAIMAGEIGPGQELPTERELVEMFGVSRASVREALGSLRAEGLVVSAGAPARAVVAADLDRPAREAMVNLMRLRGVGLEDLIELRCLLETAALERAARAPDRSRLDEAHQALETMRAPGVSLEAFDEADVRFHTALVRSSGNEAMHLMMLAMREPVEQHLLEALRSEDDPAPVIERLGDEHEAILEAVETGDEERASKLVERHIRGYYGSGP
jgi:GntR family transcriptional regulator, transcriptional repressor for pyruvate dehydrogenase complex